MKYFLLICCSLIIACDDPYFDDEQKELSEFEQIHREIRYGQETDDYPAVGILTFGFGGLCTATLIAPDLVLTAAHCVDDELPRWMSFRVGQNFSEYDIVSVVITPGYNGIGNPNIPDLAILRLNTPVNDVTPLPLAELSPSVGESLLGIGFGDNETNEASGVKRIGRMNVYSKEYGTFTTVDEGGYRPSIFRVVPGTSSQIACSGDSGGPILNSAGAVVGVASFNSVPVGTFFNYCTAAVQAGYVSVGDSVPLIQNLINNLPEATISGACKTEGERFITAEGGCRDLEGGLTFSRRLPRSTQKIAIKRCKKLVESGFSDWRLPTAHELRGMARRGGANYLNQGSSTLLWSKSREGSRGITVKMDTGEKIDNTGNKKRRIYCVRD